MLALKCLKVRNYGIHREWAGQFSRFLQGTVVPKAPSGDVALVSLCADGLTRQMHLLVDMRITGLSCGTGAGQ